MCDQDFGTDIPVLVVFGPTASGKTALSSRLFLSGLSGFPSGRVEIISADSMQVYRRMDIGTAKPDPQFLQLLPHHLLDICEPDQQFCAGDFVRLADTACKDIYSRGKLPVILGGTAFYIQNFIYGLPDTPVSDPAERSLLKERAEKEGLSILYRELLAADPVSASIIHPNDGYRIIRALEVFLSSGRPRSSFRLPFHYRSPYRFFVISLDRPREELYRRIDLRVLGMMEAGLRTEFEALRREGFTSSDPGMQAIGYREFFDAENGNAGIDTIVARIQQDSRKYAKRQETYIRSLPDIHHMDADDFDTILAAVRSFYTTVF